MDGVLTCEMQYVWMDLRNRGLAYRGRRGLAWGNGRGEEEDEEEDDDDGEIRYLLHICTGLD